MSLRPKYFNDIIGQEKTKKLLSISINSCKKRNTALGHVLIESPPGFGKTTIANAIANELGVKIKTILGGNIKSFKDILPTITNIQENEVLFIDEVHRINKRIAESLYTVLEDFRLDLPFESDSGEMEIITIDLPKFTIIGATTEIGKLVKPFIDRFKLKVNLETYDRESINKIILQSSNKLKMIMTKEAVNLLSGACRGTPRITNSLLEWVRDYSISLSSNFICKTIVKEALEIQSIDPDGTTDIDRKYIDYLKLQKQPVGVNTLVSALNIDKATIENVIEPFLLSINKISKTSKGRILL